MGSASYGDREKLAYLAELLPRCPGTGIIYTATRKSYEYILSLLCPVPQGLYTIYRREHSDRSERTELDLAQSQGS